VIALLALLLILLPAQAVHADGPDVSVTKTVSVADTTPGSGITYTLTFSNTGTITATNVVITDIVPASVTDTSVISSGVAITETSPIYVWEVQNLAPGQGGLITLTGVLSQVPAGVFTNTATITATGEITLTDNTSAVSVTVSNVPPLFTTTPVTTALAGVTYDYRATVFDGNNDVLTVTTPVLPGWLTFNSFSIIATTAGTGSADYGGDGSPAAEAQINTPRGVAVDASGNIYIADTNNYCVRKVIAATGIITTIAGTGSYGYSGDGGPATSAQLRFPYDVAVDADGNVYIADQNDHRIRKVIAATGVITTIAGTGSIGYNGDNIAATSAQLYQPHGVAVDDDGNVYIADFYNDRVRKVIAATGIITTIAGTGDHDCSGDGGPATSAAISYPRGVAVDDDGNVYIASNMCHSIRKVIAATGIITNVASGSSNPDDVAVDEDGNLYVADYYNNRIYRFIAATGANTVIAGTGSPGYSGDDGPATSAQLNSPEGVAIDTNGNLYIADTDNHRIRKVDAEITHQVTGVPGLDDIGANPVTLRATEGVSTTDQSFTITCRYVDLAITKTVVAAGSAYGNAITYTLSLLNNGDNIAANVVLTDQIPTGITVQSVISSGVAITDTGVSPAYVWNVQDLSPGEGGVITITGVLGQASAGVFTNTATIMATGELTPATNTDAVTATISQMAPIFTSTPVTTPTVTAAGGVTYVYTATVFDGNGDAVTVTVPVLPTWLTFTPVDTTTIRLSGDPGPDDLGAHPVTLRVSDGISVTEQVFTITCSYMDLSITKTVTVTGDLPGDAITYTLAFSNSGNTIASSVVLTDLIPTGIVVQSVISSGAAIADTGATPAYVWDVADLAPGEGGVITLTGVLGQIRAGVFTNTAEIRSERGDVDLDNNTVTVAATAANLASLFTSTPITEAMLDVLYAYTAILTDSNGDTLSLTMPTGPAWLGLAPVYDDIATLAGTGFSGDSGDGGPATSAHLYYPRGVAMDDDGNVYIADTDNHRIRKVIAATGVITTIAGTGFSGDSGDGGPAAAAQLNHPWDVAVDGDGNVYIADTDNHRIRKVIAATGVITTIAGVGWSGFDGDGGPATAAWLDTPRGVAVDDAGNVYIADTNNHRVRRVDATSGDISPVAGTDFAGYNGDDIAATSASLYYPWNVALDSGGNFYIADSSNHRVRQVISATGFITTVAGTGAFGFSGDGGPAVSAQLDTPYGVTVDGDGNLYIADYYNYRVRRVDGATGDITTFAGTGSTVYNGDDIPATTANLYPYGVAVDGAGHVYIADDQSCRARRVDTSTGLITTVAGRSPGYNGDGIAAADARLYYPRGAATDSDGNVYIADTSNHRVRKVDVATGRITTVAGTGVAGFSGDGGLATAAKLYFPRGVALDSDDNLYIADTNNHRIRKIIAATGVITTIAGTGSSGYGGDGGPATEAWLFYPRDVVADSAGNVYIADAYNHRVRKVDVASDNISTVAGTSTAGYNGDGIAATGAQLSRPSGVALDVDGDLYIADTDNHRVRRVISATGFIITVAGTGSPGYNGDDVAATAASLYYPNDVALDTYGNLYIADTSNHRVRRVVSATGRIETVAGTSSGGYNGDDNPPTETWQNNPSSIALDANGRLYIADTDNHRIRKLDTPTSYRVTGIPGPADVGENAVTLSASDGISATEQSYTITCYYIDLHLAKAVSVSGDLPGDSITYTLAFSNAGVDVATSVVLTDQIPSGITVQTITHTVAITDTGATPAYVWDVQDLAPGEGGVVTITGLLGAMQAGVFTNTATIAATGELTPTSNTDAVTATVVNVAPIFNSTPVTEAVVTQGSVAYTYTVSVADDNGDDLSLTIPVGPAWLTVNPVYTTTISTVAGTGEWGYSGDDGPAAEAQISGPEGVAVDTDGNVYIADTDNHCIRKIISATGVITTIAGTGVSGYSGDGGPATSAQLDSPQGVAVDSDGNVYIADYYNHRIRKIIAASGIITTIAGAGSCGSYNGDNIPATTAYLCSIKGLAVDSDGNVYVADSYHNRIRQIIAASGIITTVAGGGSGGDGGLATEASLEPSDVSLDQDGNLYIADTDHNSIRQVIAATGIITTIAGTGYSGYNGDDIPATDAQLYNPCGVAVDHYGNIYIADTWNQRIRQVIATSGIITTIAGTGYSGYNDDNIPATDAYLNYPYGVAVGADWKVYVADRDNHRIRKIASPWVYHLLGDPGPTDEGEHPVTLQVSDGVSETQQVYNITCEWANVAVAKTVSHEQAIPGETITYTLTFSNTGNLTASSVVITDRIPVSVSVQSVFSSGAAISDTGATPAYVWNVQDLAPGQSGVITITGVLSDPLPAGPFTNTVAIGAQLDPHPNDDTAGVAVIVNRPPVVSNDVYTTNTDVVLSVAAPGVLDNDSDPNGDPFTAVKDSDPYTGTLDLAAAGAFTYTHPLHFHGIVTFTYHADDGLPSESGLVTITVNAWPTISSIGDQFTNEDTPTSPITFTIADTETVASELTVSGDSSNTALVPVSNLGFGGSGATRTLVITPATSAHGAVIITVTVDDGDGATASSAFTLTVNDRPTISSIADQSTNANVTTTVNFTVGDSETPAGSLTVSGDSSNTAMVPVSNLGFGGSGADRTLTITPTTDSYGTAVITITVDDGEATASTVFTLTVNAWPTVSAITDRSTDEDTPTVPITFTISDDDTELDSLIISGDSSDTTLVPVANLGFGGSGASRTLIVTPTLNNYGASVITVTVDDGMASDSTAFTLTVNSVNDAPPVSGIADQFTNEDEPTGTITFTVGDVESAPGILTVSGDSSNTSIVPAANIDFGGSGADRTVVITPALHAFGTVVITVTVDDGEAENNTGSTAFTLTVNARPTLGAVADQNTDEDTPISVLFTVADNDDPAGSLTVSGDSSNVTLVPVANIGFGGSGATRTVTTTPTLNNYGTTVITLTVDDGDATSSTAFTLTVDSVNDPPTVSVISDQNTDEDTPTDPIAFTIGDVESASGSLSLSGDSSNTALVPVANIGFGGSGADRTVVLTPTADNSGTTVITVTISDGEDITDTVFTLTVEPVNDPPTIGGIADQFTDEDIPSDVITFTVGDIDTAVSSLTLSGDSSDTALVPVANIGFGGGGATRTVVVTPALNEYGTAVITVTISDGALTDSTAFTLTVDPVNDAPTITLISDQFTNEDEPTGIVAFTVGDVETDPGVLSVYGDSSNTALVPITSIGFGGSGANRTLVITPSLHAYGTAVITVTVDDGEDTSSTAFTLTVNARPTISGIADQSTYEDTPTAAIPFTVGDADDPASSLTLSGDSSNTTLIPVANIGFGGDGANRTLVITPAANNYGTAIITITVDDGDATDSTAFTLTVNSVNDVPTISAIGDQSTDEDTPTGVIAFTVGDVETLAISLTVSGDSSNVTLVPTTSIGFGGSGANRTAVITPTTDNYGTAIITLTVDDGEDTTSTTFTLTVNSVNDVPAVSGITDQSTYENTPTAPIPFTVGDVETAPGSLTVSGDSSNITLAPVANIAFGGSGANRTVTITPTMSLWGVTVITVTVSDGEDTSSTAFTLTVNGPPTIGAITNRRTNQDTPITVPFTVDDVGTAANDLIVSGDSSNIALVPVSNLGFGGSGLNRTLTITPAASSYGVTVITVTVEDEGGLTASTAFTLTVNARPTIEDIPNYYIDEDGYLSTGFTVGDPDTPLSSLTLSAESSDPALVTPANVQFSGTGSYRSMYLEPEPNAYGNATITVTVNDGAATASKSFNLSVEAVNDSPTISEIPNQSTSQYAPITVTFTISDIEISADYLSLSARLSNYSLVNYSFGGSGMTRTMTVTPWGSGCGSVNIEVIVQDGYWPYPSTSTDFRLDINCPPQANDDTQSTWEDQTLSIPAMVLLLNDSDPDYDSLTVVLDSGPSHGVVTQTAGGDLIYTPTLNYNGADAFTYRAFDGWDSSNAATVNISITPVDDPPVIAEGDEITLTVYEDGGPVTQTLHASDPDDNTLTWSRTSEPLNGVATGGGVGESQVVGYTPNANYFGSDSFRMQVDDGTGYWDNIQVRVVITPVNDPPTIGAIANQSTNEDTSITVSFTVSDIDTGGDDLTMSAASSNPTLVPTDSIDFFGGILGSATITPTADGYGTAIITFTVNDGEDAASSAFVLTVNPVNDPPVATSDTYTYTEDAVLSIPAPGVLGNDGDIDSDPLTAVLDAGPLSGALTLNADGSFVYAPALNDDSVDSFTYHASDGVADSDSVTVTIVIPGDELALPGQVALDREGCSDGLPIGFTFTYFGQTRTGFYVSENGLLFFGACSTDGHNTTLPYGVAPNNFVAPFWDDLAFAGASSQVLYTTIGVAPRRKLIVQWTNMSFKSGAPMGTFQVILYEGSNAIRTQYRQLLSSLALGQLATVGIENEDGTRGVQYAYNAPALRQGQAIRYAPNSDSYDLNGAAVYDNVSLYLGTPLPRVPQLVSPADRATSVSPRPNFVWQAADSAHAYCLLVAENADLVGPDISTCLSQDTLSYTSSISLSTGTIYYWAVWVNATSAPLGARSAVWRFTTSGPSPTPPPPPPPGPPPAPGANRPPVGMNNWADYQPATSVLGQASFKANTSGSGADKFNYPAGVAVDPTTGKVFVVDRWNHRVLRFGAVAALTNGAAAEAVLGQPDFNSTTSGSRADRMWAPYGITVGAEGRLWVADTGNNRVLRFDDAATKPSGAAADSILGGTACPSSWLTPACMTYPHGVAVDAEGRLWVADTGNRRVLHFDEAAAKPNGAAADGVLGKPTFVIVWWPTDARADTIPSPTDLAVDAAGRLWVADSSSNRVLRFDAAAAKPNGAAADGVLGQEELYYSDAATTAAGMNRPMDVDVDGMGRLYVADMYNDRVLVFNGAAAKPNGAAADVVLGQPNFTSHGHSALATREGLGFPQAVAIDPRTNALWTVEAGRHRALRFTQISRVSPTLQKTGMLWAYDPNGDPLTYTLVTSGAHGTVTLTDPNTGAFVYQAGPDEAEDAFSFQVSDAEFTSDPFTVSVSIVDMRTPVQMALYFSAGSPVYGEIIPAQFHVQSGDSGVKTTPAGIVTLKEAGPDGVRSLGEIMLNNGIVELSATYLAGAQVLTATYSGDMEFTPDSAVTYFSVQKAQGTVTLQNLKQSYDGSPKLVTATTYPPGLQVQLDYTPPVTPGSYPVEATIKDDNYYGSANGVLVVDKGYATVSIGDLTQVYDGTPRKVSVTTDPTGLAVRVTYNGSTTPPVNPGTYSVVATVDDAIYQGSARRTLEITRQPRQATITLGHLEQTYTGAGRQVSVTTDPAGLPVEITYDGSAALPVAAASYQVVARMDSAVPVGHYLYSGAVTETLVIRPASLTVVADDKYTYPGALEFTAPRVYDVNGPLSAVAAGDLDGDTLPDLAVVNSDVGTLTVLLNQGDGTFTPSGEYELDSGFGKDLTGPRSVALGDLTGDGLADVVVTSMRDEGLFILPNQGGGTFPTSFVILQDQGDGLFHSAEFSRQVLSGGAALQQSAFLLLPGADFVAVADVDANGQPDLVVAVKNTRSTGLRSGSVVVLLNQGSGSFLHSGSYSLEDASAPSTLATGDWNNDGKTDFAATHAVSGKVSVWLNQGNGSFRQGDVERLGVPAGPANSPWGLAAADFNEDGKVDLAVANQGGHVHLLQGDGSGRVSPVQTVSVGGTPTDVAVADFNSDGRNDLLVARSGLGGGLSVILNRGSFRFLPPIPFNAALSAGAADAAVGDFDGGGQTWIAAAGEDVVTLQSGAVSPSLTWYAQGFVNGETSAVLSGQPALTTATSDSSPGQYSIKITAGALTAQNYDFTFVDGTLTAGGAPVVAAQQVQLHAAAGEMVPLVYVASSGPLTYGTPLGADQFSAVAAVAGTFGYSPALDTLLDAGEQSVFVTFTPDDPAYMAVTQRVSLIVTQSPLTVTVQSITATYGSAVPTLALDYVGFVGGDRLDDLTEQPIASTSARAGSDAGVYPIRLQGGASDNYALHLVTGTVTVEPATLSATAQPAVRSYGAVNPAFEIEISGFVNGDTAANLDVLPTGVTTATADTPVGVYTVTPGGDESQNYTFSYVSGPLTISPALLTITAVDHKWNLMDLPPLLHAWYAGFVNGETSAVLTGTPALETGANLTSPVGETYPITVTQGTLDSPNYEFAFVNGTLTVTDKIVPAVNWTPAALIYDAALSAEQLNANSPTGGAFGYTVGPGLTLPAGEHVLWTTFAPLDDETYTGVTAPTALVVAKTPLTVTVVDYSKTYRDPNPAFTVTYDGFVTGESAEDLLAQPTARTAATRSTPAGVYSITLGGGASNNYAFHYMAGTLTIEPAGTTLTLNEPGADAVAVGHPVRVTFDVDTAVDAEIGAPTGWVTITAGADRCAAPISQGACDLAFTSTGPKALSAVYAGDQNFAGSTASSAGPTVSKADVTVGLVAPDAVLVAQTVEVAFTLTTAASGVTPTGSVTVDDGEGTSCTATVAEGGCQLTFAKPGERRLVATYAGDVNFDGAAEAVNLVVNPPQTQIFLPLVLKLSH